MFPAENLRGSVGRTAAPRAESLTRGESVAEAEVGDLHVHLRVQKQVLRF